MKIYVGVIKSMVCRIKFCKKLLIDEIGVLWVLVFLFVFIMVWFVSKSKLFNIYGV